MEIMQVLRLQKSKCIYQIANLPFLLLTKNNNISTFIEFFINPKIPFFPIFFLPLPLLLFPFLSLFSLFSPQASTPLTSLFPPLLIYLFIYFHFVCSFFITFVILCFFYFVCLFVFVCVFYFVIRCSGLFCL